MYKAGAYFVECFPFKENEQWSCVVRFSRIDDYKRGADVPRVSWISPSLMTTSSAAELHALTWARRLVDVCEDQLETALSGGELGA
jgi:hypothetical protein